MMCKQAQRDEATANKANMHLPAEAAPSAASAALPPTNSTNSTNISSNNKQAAHAIIKHNRIQRHNRRSAVRDSMTRRLPLAPAPAPTVVVAVGTTSKTGSSSTSVGSRRSNNSYISNSSSNHSSSNSECSDARSSSQAKKAAEPEVFLRNPRTGGFDLTPPQREYQEHANRCSRQQQQQKKNYLRGARRGGGPCDDETETLNDSDIYTTAFARDLAAVPDMVQSKSGSTSKVNVKGKSAAAAKAKSASKNPHMLLSPRSKGSFQRYFQTKASKTPASTTILCKSNSNSNSNSNPLPFSRTPTRKYKSLGSVVQQLKCKVTGSPPKDIIMMRSLSAPAITTNYDCNIIDEIDIDVDEIDEIDVDDQSSAAFVHYMPDEIDEIAREVQATRAKQHIQQQASCARRASRAANRRRIIPANSSNSQQQSSVLVTPPRSGRSPRNDKRSLLDEGDDDDDDDDKDGDYNYEEEDGNYSSDQDTDTDSEAPSFVDGPDLLALGLAPSNPLSPCASDSSCLDFSFSTVGNHTKANESYAWTFQAVSPVLACGRDTTTRSFDDDDDDDDDSVEISKCMLQDSGFDADNDKTDEDQETVTLDFSTMNPDSLSFHSSGAILLTEKGLKRHNDKKLLQPTVEPLALRQPNGAGKLEKVVLHQKVQRLQAKELQKRADASLEEEVAARKRRQKKRNARTGAENSGSDEHHHQQRPQSPDRAVGTTSSNSPPRMPKTPTSTSPQTSVGIFASPETTTKQETITTSKPSWFKRVLMPKKTKANVQQEKKQQWKEKERKRVELAKLESEEEEIFERVRIESLRQSYLEKQRQLEATATAVVVECPPPNKKIIVDVDDLIAANQAARTSLEHSYDNTMSSTSNSTDPSSVLDDEPLLGSATPIIATF